MTDIPLRDYLQAKINALEDRIIKIQRESDQMALKLQAQEYERRLLILNNEHERVDKIVTDKVDRKEWDEYHKRQLSADYIPRIEFFAFKEEVARERALAIGEIQGKAKITALVYSIVGVILGVGAVVAAFPAHKAA